MDLLPTTPSAQKASLMEPTKAQRLNYHQASVAEMPLTCGNCKNRKPVPYNWCDEIMKEVLTNYTCDQHKEFKP